MYLISPLKKQYNEWFNYELCGRFICGINIGSSIYKSLNFI